MLWLALYFPKLPLEVFGDLNTLPFAVTEKIDGREVIVRCNDMANDQGIWVGQNLSSALALSNQLQIRARHIKAERDTLQDLAQWAYQFSNKICFEPLMLLLEVGASLHLFGGLEKLLNKILGDVEDLQFTVQYAMAPSVSAAALLARTTPGLYVTRREALQEAVASIPLRRLTRDNKARKLIQDIGMTTLGECFALPRAELARRTSPELLKKFDQLTGDAADPREYWHPPIRFKQRLQLLSEISHSEALVFPAKRLLTSLCGYLRGRGAGTQQLRWRLLHREQQDTLFGVGLLTPERELERMLEVFRERITRIELPEAVITMELEVRDCLPFNETNQQLFDDKTNEDTLLVERLSNRLGKEKVTGLSLVPDYRPEKSWRLCPPGKVEQQDSILPNQPLWLMPKSRPLQSRNNRPLYDGPLQLQAIPQRIENGWWDSQDIARDYFLARTRKGERLWVYLDRRSQQWFLHGRFD